MTLKLFYKKQLDKAIKEGYSHQFCDRLCGCTARKVVLTEAEAQAGKQTFILWMKDKLWHDFGMDGEGWLFGSPHTMQNIGLIPYSLAQHRLGINRANWDEYTQVY